MIATNLEADCKSCKKPIIGRRNTLQSRCIPCVIAEANARDKANARAQRQAAIDARKACAEDKRETKRKLEAIKPFRDLLRTCQKSFNRMVRARDFGKPCIACDRPVIGIAHASHFLSVGSHPNLRFSEANCHSGCVKCNVFLHGNLRPYRENLIDRIGLEAVEALEADNGARKYTRDGVIELTKLFNASAKQLEERNACLQD